MVWSLPSEVGSGGKWPQDKAVLCVGIKAAGTWAGLAREGWQGACSDRAEGVSCGHRSDASPFLQELCVMYLPRLYLDIHVRGVPLPGEGGGAS